MANSNTYKRKPLLSSVEDTKAYSAILQTIATAAGEEAIREAKALKIPITYLNEHNQVVKKFADGRIEVISQLAKPEPHKVYPKGAILRIRKG